MENNLKLPREAVNGLISALTDVRGGKYITLTSAAKKEKCKIDSILKQRIKEIELLEDYDDKMKRIRINEAQTFAVKWKDSRNKLVAHIKRQEIVTAKKSKNLKEVNRALDKLVMILWGKPIMLNKESFKSIWKSIERIDKPTGLLTKHDAIQKNGEKEK